MIIASLEVPYEDVVRRAHAIFELSQIDRARVLERIVARYPEAVATVMDDMGAEVVPPLTPPDDDGRPGPPPPQPVYAPAGPPPFGTTGGVPRWVPAMDLTDEPEPVR